MINSFLSVRKQNTLKNCSNIVYILINESMPEMVKIGITDNLERRIKELSGHTSVPLPFECFYAVKVEEDAKKIEKDTRWFRSAKSKTREENFYTTPEQAKSILEILEIMGGTNVTPKEDIVETPQEKQALENARKKRVKFNFEMINIQPGTQLEFYKDKTITDEVVDQTKVKFRDKVTSLTNSANIILREMGYDWSSVHGPRWWTYQGKSLSELETKKKRNGHLATQHPLQISIS